MNNQGMRWICGLLLSLFILGGCQSDITLSQSVRTGETITVSLGDANPNGSLSNINTNLLRDGDVTAVLTDFNTMPHDVTVRHLFRVYGDPTAKNGAVRGQAQWMAVIDLIDPATQNAPVIGAGDATLVLSSSKFDNDHTINTHILSGTAPATHPFIGQDDNTGLGLDKIDLAKPAKQSLVSVTGTLPANTKLAGAEYQFTIPDTHFTSFGFRFEAVVPAKLPSGPDRQMLFEFDREEQTSPNSTDVRVVITSTEGVEQAELSAFDFVLTSEQDPISNSSTYWQTHMASATVKYYDTEGSEIAALSRVVGSNE